jgi:hypothetical protein
MQKKTWRFFLSIGVRDTIIYCVVYLLGIFKMFQGLMNKPVQLGLTTQWNGTHENKVPEHCH